MSSLYLSHLRRWILQSPPIEWAVNRLKELLFGALRQGPIPQHVAFVMDGNRRFARNNQIETVEGHSLGFEALAKILEVCYKSGVRVVTIYAFSIENFNRSRHEVDALMSLAKLKLTQLDQHGDLCSRYGASIRIIGQRERVQADVLKAIDHAMDLTKDNGDAILNVCFAYTSRDEITSAIRGVVDDYSQPVPEKERPFSESRIRHSIRSKHLSATSSNTMTPSPSSSANSDADESTVSSSSTLQSSTPPDLASSIGNKLTTYNFHDPETIDASVLNAQMLTAGMPPLDMLVRTSGVERFSDFMLWQAHQDTEVFFLECLWPQFDLWHFLPVLVEWQWRRRKETREDRHAKGLRPKVDARLKVQ